MNRLKIALLSIICLWFISCQQATKETRTGEVTRDSLSEVRDDNQTQADRTDTGENLSDSQSSLDHSAQSPAKFSIREGKHNLSLQWISWEELGEAEIEYIGDNSYRIEGEQRSPDASDYLTIAGTLQAVSETELIFDGTVEHQIAHLNQGKPCVKTGKQTFKSTQNRKYWRMQDMQNCEGGAVTDYIDIYF